MDKTSELNRSRLPGSTVRLGKSLHTSKSTHSPKQNQLPFFYHTHHEHCSDIETQSIANHRSQCHRTHLRRWTHRTSNPPMQPQIESTSSSTHHNHYLNSHNKNTSTQKHFINKFSFNQHSNHLSRFYMIFVIFLIYLLEKINCDQGEQIQHYNHFKIRFRQSISFTGNKNHFDLLETMNHFQCLCWTCFVDSCDESYQND